MRQVGWIKAGLLGTALLGLAAPVLAQPDGGRPQRGERGGGFGRPAQGPGSGGGAPERGNWGGGNRPSPAAQPAPSVQQSPRQNWQGGSSGSMGRPVQRDRDGGRDWGNGGGRDRPVTPDARPAPNPAPVVQPVPGAQQPPRQNWQGSSSGNMGRDPRRDNDGRDWNGGRDRPDPRPGQAQPDRDRPNWNNTNNSNWNDRDRDRRDWNDRRDRDLNRDNRNWNDNRWRYDANRRFNDRDRWNDFRRWDNNSWRRDQRYNWQYWRNSHRDVYRLPRYIPPSGWSRGYSRFSIGIFINSFWFGSNYWLDDPYLYRLPPAYGSLRWIRYYDDALLVDMRDGYVVDVVYDVFW